LQEKINSHLKTIDNVKKRELEKKLLSWHVANLEYGCGIDLVIIEKFNTSYLFL
jgi:hypothetical protein